MAGLRNARAFSLDENPVGQGKQKAFALQRGVSGGGGFAKPLDGQHHV